MTDREFSPHEMALDEELVSANIGVVDHYDDYDAAKKKLRDLINWHVTVATDPRTNGGYKLVKQDSQ